LTTNIQCLIDDGIDVLYNLTVFKRRCEVKQISPCKQITDIPHVSEPLLMTSEWAYWTETLAIFIGSLFARAAWWPRL